ncbi:MAG: hypothetical protein IAE80_09475 [Anaerolinea sp.]|nr:hypothetical protein [Anaerolinea sp.]
MNDLLAVERGRRNLRIILVIIIAATVPFYCAGIILLSTAPTRSTIVPPSPTNPRAVQATNTVPGFASVTPLPQQGNSTLAPTPGQFFTPVQVTFVLPPTLIPTVYVYPTLTIAPSLTPFPSDTPQPTWTNTTLPQPTLIPPDTETPTSTPTDTATLEIIPPGDATVLPP